MTARSSSSSRSPPNGRDGSTTGPERTREEPDRSLDEMELAELRRREREAAIVKQELSALKSFSEAITQEFVAGKTRQQYALDMQHATYLDIVRSIEDNLAAVQAQRDAWQRRAEAAEAKVEVLACKLTAMIRRKQHEEELELRAFADRVANERDGLLEVVTGFSREMGVDPSPIIATRDTASPTIADVTALLDCMRAHHMARTQAVQAAVKPMPAFTRDLTEKMSMAVIMINRRLNHEDVVTGSPLHGGSRSSVGATNTQQPQPTLHRVDTEHWEITNRNAMQQQDRTPSAHSVTIDDDEDVFDALRLVLTDGLVALKSVESQIAALTHATSSDWIVGDPIKHHQVALSRITKQLETQLGRHSQFRLVSKAMLDAAESEYLALLQRRLGIAVGAAAATTQFSRAVQGAAAAVQQATVSKGAHPQREPSPDAPRALPTEAVPTSVPQFGRRMLSPPSSYE